MENKYYTPEIEEFYVGFEFEEESISKLMYHKKIFRFNLQKEIVHGLDNNIIRVKYLDREDIESLGFVKHKTIDKYYKFEDLILRILNDKFEIYLYDEYYVDKKIFSGTIKNKSELKKLIKQLKTEE